MNFDSEMPLRLNIYILPQYFFLQRIVLEQMTQNGPSCSETIDYFDAH